MEFEKYDLEIQQNDYQEVKNLKYFMQKINTFYNSVKGDFILIDEFKNFLENLNEEVSIYINSIYDNDILLYKSELSDIVYNMKVKIEANEQRAKPIKLDLSPYYEQATIKLISMFNKNGSLLTNDEARSKYNDIEFLEKKYKSFVDLIEWCNTQELSIIPDRIMICSYLRITLEIYEEFLNSNANEKIQNIFKSIENYIISLRLNAGEMGTRNSSAIKTNVSYDLVGNSLKPNDNAIKTNNNLIITNEDIIQKMKKLGFTGGNEERENKKIIDYTK